MGFVFCILQKTWLILLLSISLTCPCPQISCGFCRCSGNSAHAQFSVGF
ncbi:unnamed protein product, partial [Staurois parvus]